MRQAVFAFCALALLGLTGCKDEPVTTVAVTFEPEEITLLGSTHSATLSPQLNIDPRLVQSATWSVTHVTGYSFDFDSDGTIDTGIPEAESVSLSGASSGVQAQATFVFQGIYIIQLAIKTSDNREGRGSIKVTVGDSANPNASDLLLPIDG